MNAVRNDDESCAVVGSPASSLAYVSRSAKHTTRNTTPANVERLCAWLKRRCTSAWSLRPAACDTSATQPTESICESAIATNIRFVDIATAATACLPRRPTQ